MFKQLKLNNNNGIFQCLCSPSQMMLVQHKIKIYAVLKFSKPY